MTKMTDIEDNVIQKLYEPWFNLIRKRYLEYYMLPLVCKECGHPEFSMDILTISGRAVGDPFTLKEIRCKKCGELVVFTSDFFAYCEIYGSYCLIRDKVDEPWKSPRIYRDAK